MLLSTKMGVLFTFVLAIAVLEIGIAFLAPGSENSPVLFHGTPVPPESDLGIEPLPFTNSIGMKFVWIRPGSFIMGSPKDEPLRGRNSTETQHKVTLMAYRKSSATRYSGPNAGKYQRNALYCVAQLLR